MGKLKLAAAAATGAAAGVGKLNRGFDTAPAGAAPKEKAAGASKAKAGGPPLEAAALVTAAIAQPRPQ